MAWVVGWLIPLLLILLLAGLAVWAILRVTGHSRAIAGGGGWSTAAGARGDSALELVRARYARGEISREEFVQLSADLGAPAPPGDASTG
ncbi:MAG: SHOCT domain-containing protein [Actinomycetota bacterium]